MKIGVVIPSFYPAVIYGGTIFSSLNTCRQLVKKGHEIFVSTTNTNMYDRLNVPVSTWIPMDGFFVKYYNETKVDKFSLSLCCNVWKDIRRADIIHIQAIFNTPTPVALCYAFLFNKPVVLSPRGVLGDWIMNQGNSFKKTWLNMLIKPFANHVTWHATAQQEKEEIKMHFPKATIKIIPNGIDTSFYDITPHLSREEYIRRFTGTEIQATRVIVSMGRLHKKKGFDLLIHAFKLVREQRPDTLLFIAGQDEGEWSNLKKLSEELHLSEYVYFLGALDGDTKRDFLVHADLFALPSHNENFGNVYAEALAAGIPVVTSIHTPWLDLDEYNCGKAVKLDKELIASAISEYLNKDKPSKQTKAYISKFTWEAIGQEFSNLFESIHKK